MGASAQYSPPPASPDLPPTSVNVYRLVQQPVEGGPGNGGSSPRYHLLPNVRAISDSAREYEHGAAQCSYIFDQVMTVLLGTPILVEQVFGIEAQGKFIVQWDDRIVFRQDNPDGTYEVLFDGFAQVPDASLGSDVEQSNFTVIGTPAREWDTPLVGPIMRDAADPTTIQDVFCEGLRARFNPDGVGNCTPEGTDHHNQYTESGTPFPVFIDPTIDRDPPVRFWSLARAVQYILNTGNPKQEYTQWEHLYDSLDDLLSNKHPIEGEEFDPNDPSTYELQEIIAHDLDVTGKAWPEALQALLEPHGFGFRWEPVSYDDNSVGWDLLIWRKDDDKQPKTLKLPAAGTTTLDPNQVNLASGQLALDMADLANQYAVDTRPRRYEVSMVLAPAFPILGGDAAAADNPANSPYDTDAIKNGTFLPEDYRVFILDEAGDGHADAGGALVYDATDLSKLFPPTDDGLPTYVQRHRPLEQPLFSTDPNGIPYKAQLWIGTGYTGPVPGLWQPKKDSGAQWQLVSDGDWQLLPDRAGIRITAKNPNDWSIGKGNGPFPSGMVRVVQCLSSPTQFDPKFVFRLTAVIESDVPLDATAKAQLDRSPTLFLRERREDARDQYVRRTVSWMSNLAKQEDRDNEKDRDTRDDTKLAMAHAEQKREAHQYPHVSGPVTIARITNAYQIGDKVSKIEGRNLSLQTNLTGSGNKPTYPSIIARDRTYHPEFSTTFQLDDRRAEGVAIGKEGELENSHGKPKVKH
jgi:hypothetical protein